MMTLQRNDEELFQSCIEALYRECSKSEDALDSLKQQAWEHLEEIGLPTRKAEVFRYVKLRRLYAMTLEAAQRRTITQEQVLEHVLPECQGSVLVFVNGFFEPDLSCTENITRKVVTTSLSKAMRTYGTFLTNYRTKSLHDENDGFAVMNAALQKEGLFVYIPPKTIVEKPIQILNFIDAEEVPMLIVPAVQVFVGTRSEASFIFSQKVLSGSKYFVNQVEEFYIEDDSHVKCYQDTVEHPDGAWNFDAFRATMKSNGTLNLVHATEGGTTVRHDYRVVLSGENSEALLNGVWMLKGSREAHVNVVIEHQAPNCRSFQLFKGAIDQAGRSSFEGKILIRKEAQKTDAYQLNQNLILSDTAKADSKPNLEIFADDVKASHGSTVGQLDQDQLLYLQTRGIAKKDGEALLVNGFCQSVIHKFDRIPSLLKKVSLIAQSFRQKDGE